MQKRFAAAMSGSLSGTLIGVTVQVGRSIAVVEKLHALQMGYCRVLFVQYAHAYLVWQCRMALPER